MIQRIQSLFLLLITALAVALFFFPVFLTKITSPASPDKIVPFLIQSNLFISIVTGVSGLTALITIFLYGNRQRQMLLCRLNILFIIGVLGLILQASDTSALPLSSTHITIEYLFAIYFPILQIVLDWLAIRFIKKDNDLVRSAERLR